jgi:hypothetical protein
MSYLNFFILDFSMNRHAFLVILLCFLIAAIQAQDTIRLQNPSLEDRPTCCRPPSGWESLDFDGYTPPDVQPGGGFKVANIPAEGRTYVSMVTRDDGTFETIYQKLSTPLLPNVCYKISVFLAKSLEYTSGTKWAPNHYIDFLSPTIIQILGGNSPDDPELEILNASTPVDHYEWIEYVFEFIPTEDFSYIFLSAFYPDGIGSFTNGHILVDNLSDIVPCEDITD